MSPPAHVGGRQGPTGNHARGCTANKRPGRIWRLCANQPLHSKSAPNDESCSGLFSLAVDDRKVAWLDRRFTAFGVARPSPIPVPPESWPRCPARESPRRARVPGNCRTRSRCRRRRSGNRRARRRRCRSLHARSASNDGSHRRFFLSMIAAPCTRAGHSTVSADASLLARVLCFARTSARETERPARCRAPSSTTGCASVRPHRSSSSRRRG